VKLRLPLLSLTIWRVFSLLCILQVSEPAANLAAPPGGRRSGVVTPPVVINSPQPDSVPPTSHAEYQGTVLLQIEVDERGDVAQVWVLKPLSLGLDEKAVASVRAWKFRPATRNGVPTRARLMVEINFRLAHPPHYDAQCPVPFAFGTVDSNGPKKLTWEDLSNQADHWWTQQKKSGKLSSLCLASPSDSRYAIIWKRPPRPQAQRVVYVYGSGLSTGDPEDSAKGVVEVFSMSKGEVNSPALFTSKGTSCKNGFKEAVRYLAGQAPSTK